MEPQIGELFELEIREKRRSKHYAAARKKTGVKRSRGGVRTQYDFLTREEKKLLNGKVEKYNMYETILTKNEFLLKDEEQQKTLLTRWREIYPNNKIAEGLGIPEYKLYDYINKLGIKKKQYTRTRRGIKKEESPKQQQENSTTPILEQQPTNNHPIANQWTQDNIYQQPTLFIPRGEQWSYNNVYSGKKLVSHLEKLLILLDGEEESEFEVSILITPKSLER